MKIVVGLLLVLLAGAGCGSQQRDSSGVEAAIARSDSLRRGLLGFSPEPFLDSIAVSTKRDSQGIDTINLWRTNVRNLGTM